MRIRDLKRMVGEVEVPAWPPMWYSSYGPGSTLATGEVGVLRAVRPVGNLLSITMEFDGREHVGIMQWDGPPTPTDVAEALRGRIGQEISTISNVETLEARRSASRGATAALLLRRRRG